MRIGHGEPADLAGVAHRYTVAVWFVVVAAISPAVLLLGRRLICQLVGWSGKRLRTGVGA